MWMTGAVPSYLRSALLFLALGFCCFHLGAAQMPIPARYDGFVYQVGAPPGEGSVVVEAFFDPLCPDSQDAWPPLRRVIQELSPRVFLVVHPFALPYHDNSFFSCRALHIANKLNKTTTFPLLEIFFKYQEKLYNSPTRNMSRDSVIQHIVDLAVEAIGNSSRSAFENGFGDQKSDMAARISFKYGCSRGVVGTPFFFVNGFPLPSAGDPLNYGQWRGIIDPLLSEKSRVPQVGDISVSYTIFADDLTIFLKNHLPSVQYIAGILEDFGNQAELHLNKGKSKVYVGKAIQDKEYIMQVLGILGTLPVPYLGLPLLSTAVHKHHCQPIIDKIHKRITSWKMRFLSKAGRLELIRAVLSSLSIGLMLILYRWLPIPKLITS